MLATFRAALLLAVVVGLSSAMAAPGGADVRGGSKIKAKAQRVPKVNGTLADGIMREATSRMTDGGPDGFREDELSLDELMERYDRGERLYIGCGTQARVARVLLARRGIRSRLVAVLSASGPFDGHGDGHTFMEIWIKHHWIAYDPDMNRRPVDSRGSAMGAAREVRTRPFHWRYTASDLYSDQFPDATYAQLDRVVDHVMGILVILVGPEGAYDAFYRGTPKAVARVESYPSDLGYIPVGKRRWAKITKGEA